ncbi:unnamed protein product [Diatraea saccharalis]|uniref:Uncharacterized protein n=1 Tax=Diatraea saccharalis TaxID=40085 RepID=A0A9N9WE49_9NEOP|nr:unnamed protein product [Diatraea saccharalis]
MKLQLPRSENCDESCEKHAANCMTAATRSMNEGDEEERSVDMCARCVDEPRSDLWRRYQYLIYKSRVLHLAERTFKDILIMKLQLPRSENCDESCEKHAANCMTAATRSMSEGDEEERSVDMCARCVDEPRSDLWRRYQYLIYKSRVLHLAERTFKDILIMKLQLPRSENCDESCEMHAANCMTAATRSMSEGDEEERSVDMCARCVDEPRSDLWRRYQYLIHKSRVLHLAERTFKDVLIMKLQLPRSENCDESYEMQAANCMTAATRSMSDGDEAERSVDMCARCVGEPKSDLWRRYKYLIYKSRVLHLAERVRV